MSGKFALIIGNTEYTDAGLAQLAAPGKDAEDFARVLKDPGVCAFDDVNVLMNQPSHIVGEAIDAFFYQKKPEDLLIVYFSGHGVRDEFGTLYLAVKNTNRTRLRATAIRSDFIREAMDQSRSKRQVVILDCCNSGAFPQGAKAEAGGAMGMVAALQGYGRFVLTASDATQFAWEGDKVIGETQNSLFTHFLLKGLKEGEADLDGDGKISVDELYDYVYQQISSVTPNQTPTKASSKVEGDIFLRQITRIEDIKPVSLPEELVEAIEDARTFVREGAIQQLEKLLKGKKLGLARSAREALERMEREDDSRRVSQAATQALEPIRQAEKLALQKADEERLAHEQADVERKTREAAEKLEQEAARLRAERETIEQAAREASEKVAREKAEKEAAEREAMELASRQKAERDTAERAEREANELASRKEAERKAKERTTGLQGKTKNPQPIMKWVMIGIIGLCIIGIGAWGIPYLASLVPVVKTPAATVVSSQESTIGNPQTTEKIKVGLSFSDLATERWKNESFLMRRLLEEKGYEVISQEANNDAELQNDQIDNMVAQGVKGLIVIAEDGAAAATAVDKAVASGVKVIAYDRLIKTTSISAYLSFNSVEVGRQQALGVMTALGIPGSPTWTRANPARVVLSGGSPTDNNAVLVRQGQMEVIQPYIDEGIITIVADQWVDNWDAANAETMMKNILKAQNNRIDAVIASNDSTALGELQAMKVQGLAGKVPISGQDATAESCNSIVKGEQTVSVYKDIRLLSPKAVDTLDALLKGQPVSGLQKYTLKVLTGEDLEGTIQALFLPVVQVTKDNVYDLVVKSGFQSYDNVYRDIPEDQRPPRP